MQGWGVRPGDWQIGVTLQRELIPRVSLEVGYTRRWLQNFTVTDNRATTVADYTPYSITAPLDPRLPGGGGYTVSGLYDVVPAKSGVTDNLRTYGHELRNAVSELQRRGHQRERAAAQRPAVSSRQQHRASA